MSLSCANSDASGSCSCSDVAMRRNGIHCPRLRNKAVVFGTEQWKKHKTWPNASSGEKNRAMH